MSEQADTTQDTQFDAPGQTAPEAAAPDPIMQRMDELAASIQALSAPTQPQEQRGLTDYAMQQFQQPGEPEAGPDDEFGYEPEDDAQAEARAYQQLQEVIREQVQQGVQQQIQPWIVRQEAEALEQKYPDLATPEVAQRVMAQAEQFAQRLGMPELAGKPAFIEKLYLAERAGSLAAQETPADGGTGVHLEVGGATPQQPEVDERDRIVGLGRSNNSFGWS